MAAKKEKEETPAEAEQRRAQEQTEDGDNSVLTTHEAYLGADPIYRNAADVTQEPQVIEGDPEAGVLDGDLASELVERVTENEELAKKGVNEWGSGYSVPHPSENETAIDKEVARQKLQRDAATKQAQDVVGGGSESTMAKAPPTQTKKDADTPKG